MHRIVQAHLRSYVASAGLGAEDEASQFEKFVNFAVLSDIAAGEFDIDEISTSQDDDGTDGIAIIIDEDVIVSADDAQSAFSGSRRNHDVVLLAIQAKRSENFDLGDFLKFKESVLRFVTQTEYECADETMSTAREIFDVVLNEVPKIRDGKPSIVLRYVTTGNYQSPAALEKARVSFENQLHELGLFSDVDIKFLGRDDLTRLWVSTYSGVSSSLELFSNAALPTISGIDEAYLAVVKAADFVEKILLTPDGNLRTQVFEENVRSFLGSENPVNASIANTLTHSSSSSRFPVLNNGITIVSPDVRLQGNTLHLANYQIVNGCQTSNVLYENRHILGETMVNIKVVETQNEDVFSELVRATNSQSKVEETQFLSLRPIIRRVEQYFNTFDDENRIYFERRDRQYVGQNIPATRIFSVHNAAKCVAAMYCNRPELSARYPKTMYEELTETIFDDSTKENIFYASCMTLYRFNMLVSNSTIPQNMKRFKWHMLPIVKAMISGKAQEPLNSKAASQSAEAIIAQMEHHSTTTTDIFNKAVTICQSLGEVSRDRLKRQPILAEMMAQV